MKTLRVVRAGQFLILSAVVFLFQTATFAQTVGGDSIPVVTNLPPVSIFSPKEGMTFDMPTNILITAILNDVNWLTNVEFFVGGNDLGKGILELGTRGGFSSFTWTNPSAGNYTLTAVASYNDLAWTKTSPPVGYYAATSAPVNITVSSSLTNFPLVSIISPPEGATFYAPTNVQITAAVSYLTPTNFGNFTSVEFFAGDNDLGKGIWEISSGFGGALLLTWTNPPPGNYALRAVASYSGNVSITSAPVNITVSLPVTNFPPVVRMVSPANGAVFHAPVNLPLFAYAAEPNSTDAVASVEFFAGTNSLGFGQPVKPTPIFPPIPIPVPLHTNGYIIGGPIIGGPIAPVRPVLPLNLYSLDWSNAPVGAYELTAVATSGDGMAGTSAPVKIAVLSLPPPPTNRPAVVSIVATDPVAVAGTNSWTWSGETNSIPSWKVWPSAVCRFFTNAGPKTATFTVRRAGDTNDDLTVLYQIGGTASNGVDYVALPGFVTVSAGERAALITVVPTDNDSNRLSSAVKTVILKLTPSTNADYLIGFPRRAAAVIVDGHRPRPASGLLPGGSFHLNAAGPDAAWFRIEDSTNLVNWTPVCTNQVINGSIDFIDPDAPNRPSRFYRAVPLTNAPGD